MKIFCIFEVKNLIMNIDSRKISITKQILSLNNDNMLKILEDLLSDMKLSEYESNLTPMSLKQYKDEIKLAIQDEKEGRIIKATDLKKQISGWS